MRRVEARADERLVIGFVPAGCADVGGYLEEKIAEKVQEGALPAVVLVNPPEVDRHAPGNGARSKSSAGDTCKSGEVRRGSRNAPENAAVSPALSGTREKERVSGGQARNSPGEPDANSLALLLQAQAARAVKVAKRVSASELMDWLGCQPLFADVAGEQARERVDQLVAQGVLSFDGEAFSWPGE